MEQLTYVLFVLFVCESTVQVSRSGRWIFDLELENVSHFGATTGFSEIVCCIVDENFNFAQETFGVCHEIEEHFGSVGAVV